MGEQLRSILVGTLGLSLALGVAVVLTLRRSDLDASETSRRAAARLAGLAILLQSAHFAEELATGFHRRFPVVLGLVPWPTSFFVSFNLFWLAVWMVAVVGLVGRYRVACFPLWFLGIASVANGLAHPALALRAGGYFPGLATSTFVGLTGLSLLRCLFGITRQSAAVPKAA